MLVPKGPVLRRVFEVGQGEPAGRPSVEAHAHMRRIDRERHADEDRVQEPGQDEESAEQREQVQKDLHLSSI